MKKHEVKSVERVFDGFLKVDEAELRHTKNDGTWSNWMKRLNVNRGDSVAGLIYHRGDEEFILVKQFRYPTSQKGDGWIIEVIAGMIDEEESPEEALKREAEEEVGYRIDNIELISTFYTTPGGSSERIHLFYGETDESLKVSEGGGVASEDEDIEIIRLKSEEALGNLISSQNGDAKTVIALQWWAMR